MKDSGFGKWLGKSNGMAMLADIFQNGCTKSQAKAAVTTYCLLFDVKPDTDEWNDLMKWIYDHYNCWSDFQTVDDIGDYMSYMDDPLD